MAKFRRELLIQSLTAKLVAAQVQQEAAELQYTAAVIDWHETIGARLLAALEQHGAELWVSPAWDKSPFQALRPPYKPSPMPISALQRAISQLTLMAGELVEMRADDKLLSLAL